MNGSENPIISLSEAGRKTGYTAEYLRQLCVQGKLVGKKVGKTWLVTNNALNDFINTTNKKTVVMSDVAHVDFGTWLVKQKIAAIILTAVFVFPIMAELIDLPKKVQSAKTAFHEIVAYSDPSTEFASQQEYFDNIIRSVKNTDHVTQDTDHVTRNMKQEVSSPTSSNSSLKGGGQESTPPYQGGAGEVSTDSSPSSQLPIFSDSQSGSVLGTSISTSSFIESFRQSISQGLPDDILAYFRGPRGEKGDRGESNYVSGPVQYSIGYTVPSAQTPGTLMGASSIGAKEINTNNLTVTTQFVTNTSVSSTFGGPATFNGDVTLGDSSSDTVTFNSQIASDLIPSLDNTYTIGNSINRWSEGNLSSLIIRNDNTDTNKATFAFSSSVAKLSTDSATPLQLTTGANTGLYINTAGNVGVGTTEPNNLLQVSGLINFNNSIFGTTLGYQAGYNVSASQTIFVGYQAGYGGTPGVLNTGLYNIALGNYALYYNTTGQKNIALGYKVLQANTTGSQNTASGYKSLNANTTGSQNTASGDSSLLTNTIGYLNVAVGYQALLFNTEGYENTAAGSLSAANNTTGNDNTALGYKSLYYNTTGSNNTAIGGRALYFAATSGSNNTALGYQAGYGVFGTTNSNNTLVGYKSGVGLSTGSNNILLGYQSGDTITTGSNNIVIGYDIDTPAINSANTLNIGNLIYATGLDGTGTILSTGNVGIGTTSPGEKLQVAGTILTASSSPTFSLKPDLDTGAQQVIFNNAAGNPKGRIQYYSNTDYMAIWTANTERIRVNSSGNVGIGTTSPQNKLHTIGNIQASVDVIAGANIYGMSPILTILGNANTGYTSLWANGAEKVRIQTDGNVGIGTTSPILTFQVAGANYFGGISDGAFVSYTNGGSKKVSLGQSSSAGYFYMKDNPGTTTIVLNAGGDSYINGGNVGIGTTTPGKKLEVRDDTDAGILIQNQNEASSRFAFIKFQRNLTGVSTDMLGYIGYDGTTDNFKISNSSDALSGSADLVVTRAGNVGIGTTTPTKVLNVVGANDAVGATIGLRDSSSYALGVGGGMVFQGSYTTGGVANFGLIRGIKETVTDLDQNGALIFATGLMGTLNERVRITSNGNVGIGTTGPGTKLVLRDATAPTLTLGSDGTNAANSGAIVFAEQTTGTWGTDTYGFRIINDGLNNNLNIESAAGGGVSNLVTIQRGGNVGIGTTAPGGLLHVSKANGVGDVSLVIQNYATTDGETASLLFRTTTSALDDARITTERVSSGNSKLNFWTNTGGTTTNRMTINQLGNVGIGTTSPGEKLVIGDGTTRSYIKLDAVATQEAGISLAKAGVTKWSMYTPPSSNDLRFYDGSDRVTIQQGGNVGIGTTAPAVNLNVYGAFASTVRIGAYNTTSYLDLQGNAGADTGYINWNENGSAVATMQLQVNGSTKLTINNSGNVGIGTTGPGQLLHLYKSGASSPVLQINSDTYWSQYSATLIKGGTSDSVYGQIELYNGSTGALSLQARGSNNLLLNPTAGNVGIGTTAPGHKLDVKGAVSTSDDTVITGSLFGITDTANTHGLYMRVKDATTGISGLTYSNQLIANAGNAFEIFSSTVQPLVFGTNGAERMRITSGGNVGIGTTAPGAKLHVSGTNSVISVIEGSGTSGWLRFDEAGSIRGYFGYGDAGHIFGDALTDSLAIRSSGALHLGSGAVSDVTIDTGGNVGIGTTGPTYRLDVKGTTQAHGIRSDMGFDIYAVSVPTFGNGNLALTTGGSNLEIGPYVYSMTYTTALGETSVSADATITTDASNRKVTITVPVSSDPRVTGRKIYRTLVGGATYASKLLTTIADNTTTIYVDDVADGSLTGSTAYFRSNTTSKYITVNGSQVFNISPSSPGNVFVGNNVGNSTLTEGRNVGFGNYVLYSLTSGNSNVAVGNSALAVTTSGGYNIAMGYGASYANTTGSGNVSLGHDANIYNATGGYSVSIGYVSGFGSPSNSFTNSTSLGAFTNYLGTNQAIHLGYFAGRYETAAQKLIIDNQDRGTEAASRTSALIYGVFNATPANQILALGGGGNVGIGTTAPSEKLSITNGNIYIDNSDSVILNVDKGGANKSAVFKFLTAGVDKWYVGTPDSDLLGGGDEFMIGSTSTTPNLWIEQSGNVGIGTTAPGADLDIVHSSGYGGIYLKGNSDSQLRLLVGYGSNYIESMNYAGNGNVPLYITGTGGNEGSTLNLNMATTKLTGELQVDGMGNSYVLGNVGIGTTAPGAKLDITGGAGMSLRIGSDYNTETRTDNTDKAGRISMVHYDIDEEPMAMFYGYSSSSDNIVAYGGGSSLMNAATSLKFYTAANTTTVTGTERMRIDSAGNVGVGTASPGSLLHIKGATPTFRIESTGDMQDNTFDFKTVDGRSARLVSRYTNSAVSTETYLAFHTNVSGSANDTVAEVVRIAGGNVGIGTTAPGSALQVGSATGSSLAGRITLDSAAATEPGIVWNNAGTLNWLMYRPANTTDLRLYSGGDKVTFQSGGNVGIGTTAPGASLDIQKTGDVVARIKSTDGNGAYVILDSSASTGNYNAVVGRRNGAESYRIGQYGASTDVLQFSVGTTFSEKMRIQSGGNVGIGTTAPGGILDINGATSIFRGQIAFTGTDGVTNGIALNYVDGASADAVLNIRDNAASVSRVTFLQTGNVGVGTTAPAQKFDVNGFAILGTPTSTGQTSTQFHRIRGTAITDTGVNWYGTYGGLLLNSDSGYTSSARKFLITNALYTNKFGIIRSVDASTDPTIGNFGALTSGTVDFVIDNTGNVGIGTTAPYGSLDVKRANDIAFAGTGYRIATFTSTAAINADLPGIHLGYDTSGGGIIAPATQAGTTNFLGFWTYNSGWGERMRIAKDGNVGIGTTNPDGGLLHVQGNVHLLSGSVLDIRDTNHAITYNASMDGLEMRGYAGLVFKTGSVGASEQMRITNAGNVGIGTVSPQSKLHIAGTISYGSARLTPTNAGGESAIAFYDDVAGTDYNDAWLVGQAGWGNVGKFVIGNENNGAGGNVRLTIQKDGNVGIGTTSPGAPLQVFGGLVNSTPGIIITSSNQVNSGQIRFGSATYHLDISHDSASTGYAIFNDDHGGASTGGYYFRTAGADRVTIKSDGNVGISTISPQTKLHIYNSSGTTAANETIRSQGVYSGTGSGSLIRFTNYHSSGTNPNSGEYNLAGIAGYDYASTWGGALALQTAADGCSGGCGLSTRMIIIPNGNVGIGVTNPSAKMDVNGTTRLRSTSGIEGGTTLYFGGEEFVGGSDIGGADYGYIRWDNDNNTYAYWGDSGENGAFIIGSYNDVRTTTSDVVVLTSPSAVVVDSQAYFTGNVGIGTTAPASKLHVDGAVEITNGSLNIRSTNNIWLEAGAIKQDAFNAAGGTTLVHNANGYYYDLTSSLRYKENVRYNYTVEAEALQRFLSLSPAMWDYKNGMEIDAVSFISEDLANLNITTTDGRSIFTNYDSQGRPESNKDYTLIAIQHLILQKLDRDIQELNDELTAYIAENNELRILNNEPVSEITLTNVKSIASISGKWSISDEGKIMVTHIEVGTSEQPSGITLYDFTTKQPYCVIVNNGEFEKRPGKCEDVLNTQPAVVSGEESVVEPSIEVSEGDEVLDTGEIPPLTPPILEGEQEGTEEPVVEDSVPEVAPESVTEESVVEEPIVETVSEPVAEEPDVQ